MESETQIDASSRSLGEDRTRPGLSASERRLLRALAGVAIVASMAATGVGLFYITQILLTLVPLVALTSALWTRRPLDAAFGATLGMLVGTELAAAVSRDLWPAPAAWLPGVAIAALVAGVLAAVLGFALSRSKRLDAVMAFVAVVVLLGSVWLAVFQQAAQVRSDGRTLVEVLQQPVQIKGSDPDEVLYLAYLRELERGVPYYSAASQVLAEASRVRVSPINLTSPLSYRLPTLYWLLSRVSTSGRTVLVAALVLATLAVASAFGLARRFVPPSLALLGSTIVAAYFVGYLNGPMLLDAELWAGAFGLAFTAAFVRSCDGRGSRSAFRWLALSAAIAASLVRELGVAFILVGLAAALLEAPRPNWRAAIPWLAGLSVVGAVYALHWHAAAAAILVAAPVKQAVTNSWLQPFGRPLSSGVRYAGDVMAVNPALSFALVGLGLLGSLVATRDTEKRFVLVAVAVGGTLAVSFLGPSGAVGELGLTPAHWVAVVMPTVLACVPLAFTPFVRERGETPGQ